MANKPKNPTEDSVKETEVKEPEKLAEQPKKPAAKPTYITEYNIEELAEAAKEAFGTHKVIVLAALKAAGKEAYSLEEAKKIVTAFKTKEVK